MRFGTGYSAPPGDGAGQGCGRVRNGGFRGSLGVMFLRSVNFVLRQALSRFSVDERTGRMRRRRLLSAVEISGRSVL